MRTILVLVMACAALATASIASAAPPNWPADRPHPVFSPAAVVPAAAVTWAADTANPKALARTAAYTYCTMNLAGVFKTGGNIWGSGSASCTWNVTHIQMTLCLYRTSWLALVRCGRVLYAAGHSGAGSIVNDCPAGNQRFYMSGQVTTSSPQGGFVSPLGWVGGQIYQCS